MPAGPIFRATLLFAAFGAPAAAQTPVTAGLIADRAPRASVVASGDPAEMLARYLRVLATNPRDLEALTGAGHAALEIGDANAALAFYARAEEVSPRNGRVKAGIGSALVQLQKPREAIRLFDDAVDLGVPEADVASDRGLALDLRGDNKRAQKAYAVALGAYGDDETKRRMALSMAITGDRDGATQLLDPLLRRNDRGAWRARAFILAMGGDIAAAELVARSAMSQAQVAALRPFLVRLASLRPADKALAVNFGEMPSEGRTYARSDLAALEGSQPLPQRAPLGNGLIPDGEPFGPLPAASPPAAPPVRVSIAPSRRPGASDLASLDAAARGGGSALPAKPPLAPLQSSQVPSRAAPAIVASPVAAAPPALTTAKPVAPARVGSPSAPSAGPQPAFLAPAAAAPAAPPLTATTSAAPVSAPTNPAVPSSAAITGVARLSAETRPPAPPSMALSAVAPPSTATPPPAAPPRPPTAAPSVAKPVARAQPEAPAPKDAKAEPKSNKPRTSPRAVADTEDKKPKAEPRIWVQVAGGASVSDLPRTWAKLKPKAPALAKGQDVWTTPLRATNRLLVGPFKSDDEAQAYVNRMSKAGLSGFTFTSEKGQDIAKLSPAKK